MVDACLQDVCSRVDGASHSISVCLSVSTSSGLANAMMVVDRGKIRLPFRELRYDTHNVY